jgi:hypothetical protein
VVIMGLFVGAVMAGVVADSAGTGTLQIRHRMQQPGNRSFGRFF